VFVPKGTPQSILIKLNAEIGKALAVPAIRSRMTDLDAIAASSTPGELDKTVRVDLNVNRELVKSIGLKLD
jgi:tripartite-type tricarboxylate transporter receptor subunit TctC